MRPAAAHPPPPKRPPPRAAALLIALAACALLAANAIVTWRGGETTNSPSSTARRAGPSSSALDAHAGAIPQFLPLGVGQGAPLPVPAGRVVGDEASPTRPSDPNPASAAASCASRPAFVRYAPSAWEAEWADRLHTAASSNTSLCDAARADGDRAARLLAWVAGNRTAPPPADLVSALHYACPTADGRTQHAWAEPIEPLVGLLRHPYAVPRCTPPGVPPVHIEDRSYLVLRSPRTPAAGTAAGSPPPRALLFDAGANTYASSLGWLVDAYGASNLTFDAIYAWEAALPLNATWWNAVPPSVAPRLHAYNAPVALGSAMDPLAWMRRLARPGDTVVFKLDVGAGQTEKAFVEEIAGSWAGRGAAAPPPVLEFFYEFHHGDPALEPWFGPAGPETLSLRDAVAALTKMRESGVRAHAWP